MIRYALACTHAHEFEAWFGSSEAFDDQQARGLLECPLCGAREVAKQIMAPAVSLKSGGTYPDAASLAQAPDQAVVTLGEEAARLRAMIREMHDHVAANTEDVGSRFADEARKIHYGEREERNIRGQATREETEALIDEGIEVMALSVPENLKGPLQ
jgi:hypothetical protein